MYAIQAHLFGRFRLCFPGKGFVEPEPQKALELLCYLFLNRDRSFPREALANLLWQDVDTPNSRTYLRKALWQLHNILNGTSPGSVGLLEATPDWVRLVPGEHCWLDISSFEHTFKTVKSVPGRALHLAQADRVEKAVELYRGEILEGWYQEWCLCERERFQHMFLSLVDKLTDYMEATREYEKGIAYASRLLTFDRAHERTHRKLMRLKYLAGDRTAALRQFQLCTEVLQEELSVEPARSTVELYRSIRSDDDCGSIGTAQANPPLEVESRVLPGLLDRLGEIEESLHALRGDIRREIARELRGIKKQS